MGIQLKYIRIPRLPDFFNEYARNKSNMHVYFSINVQLISLCSPALVVSDANLEATGRRITFGRFVNTGQICIGVDYVLCMKDQRDKLVDVIKSAITEFFGEVKLINYCPSN